MAEAREQEEQRLEDNRRRRQQNSDFDKLRDSALWGQHNGIPEDVLSVSPGGLTPLLPGNEGSESDEVDITISTQIEGYTHAAFAAGRGGSSHENSDEEEDLLRREDWGGFGYDRVPNNYSDNERVEPCIVVAGIPIPVPQSRARD
ncbi:hypothetical protein MRS44_018190 [Fusarium solani]|uniref:uncharacterized protein n=1 Tax=Fusarium solani TaxID=169388 RepID=UPI0032C470DD|nr:hypothetical protein MRS44_018190 [Fusarium solani]